MLSELAIIIPSYNRPHYLERILSYWSGKSPTIIVLDGSEKELASKFLESLESNINYYHFENGSPNLRLKKTLDILSQKNTFKYCMFHADDEFFLPSSITSCIKELEKTNLVSCSGRPMSFNVVNSQIFSKPWHPLYAPFSNYNIIGSSPIKRVLEHFHPYVCVNSWAVFKIENFLNNIRFLVKTQIDEKYFELSFAICTVFQGKSKVINHLYWLKSMENIPHRFVDRKKGTRPTVPHEIISEGGFEKNQIINKLAIHLNSLNDDYSIKVLEDVIYSAFRSYAYHAKISYEIAQLFNKVKMPMSSHKKELLEMVGLWRGTDFEVEDLSLINTANIWREKGIKSDENEILEIQNHIINFNR